MNSSIMPARAPVRPRTISPETGEIVLLEDAVSTAVEREACGLVWIVGGPGLGKTVALAHLAAVLPESGSLVLVDGGAIDEALELTFEKLVIVAATRPENAKANLSVLATCPLVRWSGDECIEYLLSVHPNRCASVMQRLGDQSLLEGLPELWRVVLDAMAEDESIPSACEALNQAVWSEVQAAEERSSLAASGLEMLAVSAEAAGRILEELAQRGHSRELLRWVRHRPVRLLLAVEAIVAAFRTPGPLDFLRRKLPPELLRLTAPLLGIRDRSRLESVIQHEERRLHAMAASLLFASDNSWVPPREGRTDLSGGHFPAARWGGITFPSARLLAAHLRGADLTGADLHRTNLSKARMAGASLRGANLAECRLAGADLSGCDLSSCQAHRARFSDSNLAGASLERASLRNAVFQNANLTAARLAHADLADAVLTGANLTGADLFQAVCVRADFRGAKLENANCRDAQFFKATLSGCSLESMGLSGANFCHACLKAVLLTGSIAPGVCFSHANLRGAALAEIQWEGADLKDADLRGSTFHLGSSRSGLVGSYLAGEGSRTGFYTDEFHEQEFKSPEEIRKANLCRADLRGANLDGVDFYLVDLRGALYTPAQEEHFRRCRAILDDVTRNR